MRKLTKSVVTALSLATATLSVIPQAAAPAEAATQTKTSKEYVNGSYTVAASFYDSGSKVYSTEASFLTAAAAKVTIKSKKISSVSFTLAKDSPVYSDLTINGSKAKTSTGKDGSVTYTFAAGAYQTSSKVATFTVNGSKFSADVVFGTLPSSAFATVTETSAVVKKKVQKNSAVYNRDGAKTKYKTIKAGKTITTYGTLTRGTTKYYKVSKTASKYIKASNVDGRYITLKNAVAAYTQNLKKTKTSYKKGKKVYAYAYAILGGEKYYKLGTNKYIKALNADGRYITVKHGAVVYSKDLKKTGSSYSEGKKILTFGRITLSNKKKYYQVGQNKFIVASNVDGKTRTLKKNAYIYKKSKGKAVRYKKYVLKKNSKRKTYGSAVSIKGKKYYIISVGQYVVKSNFR